MGNYLNPGHTFTDGQTVTGPSLTELTAEATFKPTAITTQTLKDPAALTDQILIVASGAFFQTTLQQLHNLILYPGSVVQYTYQEYSAYNSFGFQIPDDDTKPQNTEGTEIISLAITPRFSNSIIRARFHAPLVSLNNFQTGVAAIFVNTTTDAIGSQATWGDNTANRVDFDVTAHHAPGSTSPVTFTVRIGPAAASIMYVNGYNSGRVLGGSQAACLTLEEIRQ